MQASTEPRKGLQTSAKGSGGEGYMRMSKRSKQSANPEITTLLLSEAQST